MIKTKRRSFLKLLFGVGAGAVASPLVGGKLEAREIKTLTDEDVGMLYDATRCIGCKACETSCKEANNLPVELGPDGLWDAPRDLSTKTVNIIKSYQGNGEQSFIKRQCMHCVDPSCVSGCPVTALKKEKNGIVSWNGDLCTGCRYCQMNCPFNIPKFEYQSTNPKIVKCELCKTTNLKEKGQPACTEICPTGAIKYGKVKSLLAEAKDRIKANPSGYIDHVYGEKENGGTSVLIISKVSFQKLGLPKLPDRSAARLSEGIQHGIYQNLITPVVLYGGLLFAAFKNRSKQKEE
jgi:Fe-S-cluster-containing dehydrogenase component